MSSAAQTDRARVTWPGEKGEGGRPILLVTLGVPFEEETVAVAVDSAVESGGSLIVANITRLEPLALSMLMGYDALEELTPDVSGSVRRSARLAAGFGVGVERLRIRTPRPVSALMELVREREPGLVVFGPDRRRIGGRLYRKAITALRAGVGCLVWLPAELDWRSPEFGRLVSRPSRGPRGSTETGGAG